MEKPYEPIDGKYELEIEHIEDGKATCRALIEKDGETEESYLTIPIGELEEVCGEGDNEIYVGRYFFMHVSNNAQEHKFEAVDMNINPKYRDPAVIKSVMRHYKKLYGDL